MDIKSKYYTELKFPNGKILKSYIPPPPKVQTPRRVTYGKGSKFDLILLGSVFIISIVLIILSLIDLWIY